MSIKSWCVVSIFALVVFSAAGRAAAMDVTACGQTVSERFTGVVQDDLDCPDSAQAVFLLDRATLDLAGHTITGGGVYCAGTCIVHGPGVIRQVTGPNDGYAGIFANSPQGKLTVDGMTLTENGFGIVSNARKTTLLNMTSSGNVNHGVWTFGAVRGETVTTSDNGGTGIKMENRGVRLRYFTATGNGQAGIINNGAGTRLVDSVVTGNAFGPFPGDPPLLDIATQGRPRLVRTVCDHSIGRDGTPWGLCSGD